MAKIIQIVFLTLAASAFCFAQSGRVKPTESPTPIPNAKPVYQPTQVQIKKPTPTPTPIAGQIIDDDDIVRVDSALVPIPVSVTDAGGRAVTNLNINDFLLQIDSKNVDIDDLFRSDTPVRLALLFDNSSSVFQAREFEKKAAIRFFKRVLRPEKDLAALFSVASGVRLEQPLTKNTSQLIDAINGLMEPKGATKLLDGIIEASNYLQDFQGRRVIVIVSDGEDNLSDATLKKP